MKCPFLSNYNTEAKQNKFSSCEQEERVDFGEEKSGGLLVRDEDTDVEGKGDETWGTEE